MVTWATDSPNDSLGGPEVLEALLVEIHELKNVERRFHIPGGCLLVELPDPFPCRRTAVLFEVGKTGLGLAAVGLPRHQPPQHGQQMAPDEPRQILLECCQDHRNGVRCHLEQHRLLFQVAVQPVPQGLLDRPGFEELGEGLREVRARLSAPTPQTGPVMARQFKERGSQGFQVPSVARSIGPIRPSLVRDREVESTHVLR
ncbi:hypothetical protein ACFYRC_21635 [Streptomyces sp. NPDC005279]|uniref:hypothetical protein n=1 Tax=Streptomyces sp. NPDC005279 TaxID=3364712 RepID=UPI0036AF37C2